MEKFKKQFDAEKEAINNITEQDLKDYYDDIMFNKTFAGLYVQDKILKDIADENNAIYRKPSATEEGRELMDTLMMCHIQLNQKPTETLQLKITKP